MEKGGDARDRFTPHVGDTTEVEKGGDLWDLIKKCYYTQAIQPRWKRAAARAAEPKKITTRRRYNLGGKG
jgi:hypothetical protein